MRKIINLNESWLFVKKNIEYAQLAGEQGEQVNVPYTWNGIDGQDGGDDYVRDAFWFTKRFPMPAHSANEVVYLEFKGVNSSADVYLNGKNVCHHDGGYSTFRVNVTADLKEDNQLSLRVDNGKTEKVYPQTADFTFYGGIYRDVNIIVLPASHFDLDFFGSCGVKITPTVKEGKCEVTVESYLAANSQGEVAVTICDKQGNVVAQGKSGEALTVENGHLWDGVKDPYLYTAKAELILNGEVLDCVEKRFGFRTFYIDPKKGAFLNGRSYPLHGVSRHQDRPKIGNALTKAEHEDDMRLIKEIGANTIRLAHYQHDDYFYDLCDENGMIVWAEIPYISRHMPEAKENAVQQMKELIYQQYHHASIVMWGVSNEITMFAKHKEDMLAAHHVLNDLVHEIDPTRITTLACFAMCGFTNKSAHITDVVAWNLYLGWYVPGFFLNDLWIKFFHFLYPNRALGYSEYGAECMPNLHSVHPRRGDNTEEYQCAYHEYMLDCFARHPYMWGTYVWNMFDFAADARNQGGEPGMNHKGLVTFDRKTKKDSFYLYKAYWSEEPLVYIAGKRFVNRTGSTATVKVYTNQKGVVLKVNGQTITGKTKNGHVYTFKFKMAETNQIEAVAGNLTDTAVINKVAKPDPAYVLHVKSETQSWQK